MDEDIARFRDKVGADWFDQYMSEMTEEKRAATIRNIKDKARTDRLLADSKRFREEKERRRQREEWRATGQYDLTQVIILISLRAASKINPIAQIGNELLEHRRHTITVRGDIERRYGPDAAREITPLVYTLGDIIMGVQAETSSSFFHEHPSEFGGVYFLRGDRISSTYHRPTFTQIHRLCETLNRNQFQAHCSVDTKGDYLSISIAYKKAIQNSGD